MALSNWDTLAFGPDSKPCNGTFDLEMNKEYSIHIHKNWIYVYTGKSYLASIHEGDLTFLSSSIEIVRAERQSSVFIFVSERVYSKEEECSNKWFEPYHRLFGGIGCYGFNGSAWVGVEKSTVDEFFNWCESKRDLDFPNKIYDEWLEKCKESSLQRFNQGDAFFAKHLGFETPSTKVGEAKDPIIFKLIK